MKSIHNIYCSNSANMSEVSANSIDLVVTSPPYPMIEMWDDLFCEMNPSIRDAIQNLNGKMAFKLMHEQLEKTWNEVDRVLKEGGIVCVNIGDATRKIGDLFELYPNHIKIADFFFEMGYIQLPSIIWRKQTNKPNKFMGSGMYPLNAYVTLEHEHILIFRKGLLRKIDKKEAEIRRESAYFWEERNQWFSDVWLDLKGVSQKMNDLDLRKKSAAYPFELAYRIINMYSIMNDTILDPFLGTGTTTLASMSSGRNSVGFEIDSKFLSHIEERTENIKDIQNEIVTSRIQAHLNFIKKRELQDKKSKYINDNYGFPTITRQEIKMKIPRISNVNMVNNSSYEIDYSFEIQKTI